MKDWMANLPEQLQASKVLEQYDSPEAALNGLIETKAHLGNSIRIPSDDASPDDMKAFTEKLVERVPHVMLKPNLEDPDVAEGFYRTLGVPDEADKYVNPEGLEIDPKQEAAVRKSALEMKLTNAQYQKVLANVAAEQAAAREAADGSVSEAEGALKGKWGNAYDQRVALAKKVYEQHMRGEKGRPFDDLHPSQYEGLYNVGKALAGEGTNEFASQPAGERGGITPEEAEMRISEIFNNKEHPYWNPGDAGHKAALKKMLELQAAKAGRTDDAFFAPVTSMRAGM